MKSSSLLPTATTTVAGSFSDAASSAGETRSPGVVATRTARAVSIVDIRQEHCPSLVECQQEPSILAVTNGRGQVSAVSYIVPGLIAAITRLANSPALPWCQRHTTTRSWSGDTVMVLLPAPLAENALVGSPASALPDVLSHQR